jgi:hypothetical protein
METKESPAMPVLNLTGNGAVERQYAGHPPVIDGRHFRCRRLDTVPLSVLHLGL